MLTIFCRFSLIFMEGGSTTYLTNLLLDFNGDLLALVNDGCSSLPVIGSNPYSIPHYLQATASVANLSSTRWRDDRMLKRFAGGTAVPDCRDSNLACLQAWILGCSIPGYFYRFSRIFIISLTCMDLHRCPLIFMDPAGFSQIFANFQRVHGISLFFINFLGFSRISGHGCLRWWGATCCH